MIKRYYHDAAEASPNQLRSALGEIFGNVEYGPIGTMPVDQLRREGKLDIFARTPERLTYRVNYNNRKVLIMTNSGGDDQAPFIVICGFTVGGYMKTVPDAKAPVTDVEPITDETERKERSN